MTLEWKVLEEEEGSLPPDPLPVLPSPRRWWRWLALLLGVGLLVVVGLLGNARWQSKQQEEQLRRDLTEIIEAEARAQGFGLVEQVGTFADTGVPPTWRLRYLHLFEPERRERAEMPDWGRFFYFGIGARPSTSGLPEVQALHLEEEGQRVSVEIGWRGGSQLTEQRAYRLVEGRWRRTPLQAGLACSWESGSQIAYQLIDGKWKSAPCREEAQRAGRVERAFPAFLLRGQSADVAALSEPGEFYLGLDALQAHLAESWPTTLLLNPFITLTVEAQEFSGPVLRPSSNEASILLNSPESATLFPHVPLTNGAQYRLMVTHGLLFTLINSRQLGGRIEGGDLTPSFIVQAEARRWALTADEQRTLRNAWRTELKGEWSSPLAPQPQGNYINRKEAEAFMSYCLSWHLLLEWMIEEGYVSSPGALARAMLESPQSDLQSLLTQLTGLSGEQLNAAARTYALTPEP
ncbi:MAG: hypothetical protein H0T73_17940 [Ardenticatenales bacterium]|nr:hypothetical protein [Ardenticatenales bacterium]